MTFEALTIRNGLLLDLSESPHPTHVYGWDDHTLALPPDATHYGLVTDGEAVLEDPDGGTWRLRSGLFFVLPSLGTVRGAGSRGLVISRLGYRGLRLLGGPPEPQGRLCYIDGCSDTLLVCPPRRGDPCLNHLHLPAGTQQTAHTHPSARLGVIWRGAGECRTPGSRFALTPGMGWHIPAGAIHSFWTRDESLDVLAWHPDSDFGPDDTEHPMVTRTLVDGRSAAEIPEIQTRDIRR